jgi:hypothetical protein
MTTLIERYSPSDKEGIFIFTSDFNFTSGDVIDFVKLSELKEQIDALHSDESSRILQASLMGDLTCDGCTI